MYTAEEILLAVVIVLAVIVGTLVASALGTYLSMTSNKRRH